MKIPRWNFFTWTVRLLITVIAIPIFIFVVLFIQYSRDKHNANEAMEQTVEQISINSNLGEVKEILNQAQLDAIQPYTKYSLKSSRIPGLYSNGPDKFIEGFWLKKGITCYSKLDFENDKVTKIGEIECENDRWIE